MFGRFCAGAVVNEQTTIVIEREKKRQSMFISDRSEVSKVPLNASDATAISFPDWMQCRGELDSKCAGNTDGAVTRISARAKPGAHDT